MEKVNKICMPHGHYLESKIQVHSIEGVLDSAGKKITLKVNDVTFWVQKNTGNNYATTGITFDSARLYFLQSNRTWDTSSRSFSYANTTVNTGTNFDGTYTDMGYSTGAYLFGIVYDKVNNVQYNYSIGIVSRDGSTGKADLCAIKVW